MSVTETNVKSALTQVIDPNTNKDLITSKSVKNIQIQGSVVNFEVELGYPAQSQLELRSQVQRVRQSRRLFALLYYSFNSLRQSHLVRYLKCVGINHIDSCKCLRR